MNLLRILLATAAFAAPALAQTAGGDAARPNRAPQAESLSPKGTVRPFQPLLGSFPTNTVTDRLYIGTQGGAEGYQRTVAGLQRTLTQLQQLQLQIKQSHWNVSGTL